MLSGFADYFVSFYFLEFSTEPMYWLSRSSRHRTKSLFLVGITRIARPRLPRLSRRMKRLRSLGPNSAVKLTILIFSRSRPKG